MTTSVLWDNATTQVRAFLMHIAPFSWVTVPQACFLLGEDTLPEYADIWLNSTPLVRYCAVTRSYALDDCLSEMLRGRLQEAGHETYRACMHRAGEWYTRSQQFSDALICFHAVRAYDNIFQLPLHRLCYVKKDGVPLIDLLTELLAECPDAIKARNLPALLRIAHNLYAHGRQDAYRALMADIAAMLSCASLSDAERLQWTGEWRFLSGLCAQPNVFEMRDALLLAQQETNGRVSILDAKTPFLFILSSPFPVFHVQAGKADEECQAFAEFSTGYNAMTGGGGSGAAELFRAGLAYYRGDIAAADLQCNRALYLAEAGGQPALQMGAARLLAQIAVHGLDMEAFSLAVGQIVQAVESHRDNALLRQQLEYELADLYFDMGLPERTPEWIQKGTLDHFTAFPRPYVKYQQMRYFFSVGQYSKTIGLGEALLSQCQEFGVLMRSVVRMYIASAHHLLGMREEGFALLEQAVSDLLADDLHLIVSNFSGVWGNALDAYLLRTHPRHAQRIFEMVAQDKQGRLKFAQSYRSTPDILTRREAEIAALAAKGLQNKEISQTLHISVHTVRAHLRSVFDKLQIEHRIELAHRLERSLSRMK